MVLFPSLVNGKVANGGRENDRVFSSFSAVGVPRRSSAGPLGRVAIQLMSRVGTSRIQWRPLTGLGARW